MDNKQWFREAKFGMMVHFGLYSLLGGEWKGQQMDQIGEWIQSYFRIPSEEYHRLTKVFNPIYFDAQEWVKTAKNAGMKYLVMTAKHHEGFALFHSKVDKYNVVDATPFKRDMIGELAEACKKNDMKFGVYYSQALDWNEFHANGHTQKELNCGVMSWGNDWDFPSHEKKDYRIVYEKKIKPQVKELLTNYGNLCLIWFDTPIGMPKEYSRELYELVKEYQPDCLVNSRIGHDLFDYESAGDNEIPDADKWDRLFETPATLNDTWGYKSYDQNWKSAKEILKIKNHLNERGINYLLNVGPDPLGRFPAGAMNILKEIARIERSDT